MGFRVGVARRDITALVPGVGMMGYVKAEQVVRGVETPLLARATVIVEPESGRRVAIACAEIWSITLALKQGVLARLSAMGLAYDEAHLLLCATHTHSGPGGYSDFVFFNASVPGFQPAVSETLIAGLAEAIAEADRNARPATLRWAAGEFEPTAEVAFNRSLAAHNANPDRERTFSPDERHLAVDREMTVLRIDAEDGAPLGLLSWFAVHAINVHHDNALISSDNKGHAARLAEEALGESFVAAFAQGAAGDVSPNYQVFADRPYLRGKYRDDFESARYNGALQAELALTLHAEAGAAPPLAGALEAVHAWVDLAEVELDPDFADGQSGCRTAPAAIGVPMLQGTAECPGAAAPVAVVARWAAMAYRARLRLEAALTGNPRVREKLTRHGSKLLFAEMDARTILGSPAAVGLLPEVDPVVSSLKAYARSGDPRPWTPRVLPLQLVVIGELALVALPAELTTQAGRRLRASLEATLAARGVRKVLLTGYANAYGGYCTTPEEYDVQLYEGASTYFGRWTLGAFQTRYRQLAETLLP